MRQVCKWFELLGMAPAGEAVRGQHRERRSSIAPCASTCIPGSLERSRTDLGILTGAICIAVVCHGLGMRIYQQAMGLSTNHCVLFPF